MLFLLAILPGGVHAQTHSLQRFEIFIVTADESETTKRIVQDLLTRLPSTAVTTEEVKTNIKATKNTIFVPIGPTALRSLLLDRLDAPIFSAFTSRHAFKNAIDAIPSSESGSVTAIYAEPSPYVQLHILSLLYKKPLRIAVLLSEKSAYMEPVFQAVSYRLGYDLSIEYVSGQDDLNRALNRLKDVTAIVAIPDSTVYNADNLRNILVTTYRRNQSVIGYSSSMVKAGALASPYSEISDINAHVAELINSFAISGKVSEAQYPKYFSVLLNEGVARSLNIVLDDQVKTYSFKPAVTQK